MSMPLFTLYFTIVAESMEKPLKYFDNNTAGMVKLLEVMNECGVKYIVFSSTAATYGIPEEIPILETTPQKPINPYGEQAHDGNHYEVVRPSLRHQVCPSSLL